MTNMFLYAALTLTFAAPTLAESVDPFQDQTQGRRNLGVHRFRAAPLAA